MAGVSEDERNGNVLIDETYEFSAPKFYDFMREESKEETRKAELWFDTASTYAPSPFMPRVKAERSFKVESLCDFSEADQIQKVPEPSDSTTAYPSSQMSMPQSEVALPVETQEGESTALLVDEAKPETEKERELVDVDTCKQDEAARSEEDARNIPAAEVESHDGKEKTKSHDDKEKTKSEAFCTPKPTTSSQKKGGLFTASHKPQKSAKQVVGHTKNGSAPKPKSQSQSSLVKGTKSDVKRNPNVKNNGTPSLAQENQAIKRQKLEGGKSRQILNLKPPQPLLHKSKLGNSNLGSSVANKLSKEERKVYVREPPVQIPFVSTAEMMKKFQSSTRDISLPYINSSIQSKPKLTLTRPKEPELETSQRVRFVKVKSTAELEEEMMAKIPKFKARPLNKKILEGPSLPTVQRSTPKPPEFQEFHLETTARANQNSDAASVASTEVSHHQASHWKPHLTEPKTPLLHTSLRARPPMVKSSIELEKEELENVPKFKARPLNKKIFESKGELGIFCNTKKQVTIPQEFHFATDERFPPPPAVADLFDKLSLNSESSRHDGHPSIPRTTMPNPFQLHTEERGAEKERKFLMELMHKQLEEERSRIPKANPYPYTTDYPVIPPKPEPKRCTKPEPFELESLVRREEEMQREMEERHRIEMEEARMRMFKAQPVLKEDPIPVPEKVRKPLTQVQHFNLHVDQRATERAEFDNKVKEKELLYKRYREESEAEKMIEEEKALKQLRRTMVPHARPVPNFNHPFCPQKSTKETTKAKSPKLLVPQRKQRRKMLNAAASSPAYNMR